MTAVQAPTSLVNFVSYLEDAESQLSIRDLSSPEFVERFHLPSLGRGLNFGNTRSTYWFRFRLSNPGAEQIPLILEVGFPLLNSIELYEPGAGGTFRSEILGDSLPFSQRILRSRHFLFPLSLPAETARTYYLKVQTTGTLSVPLSISAVVPYFEAQQGEQLMMGIFYGIFLGAALYNLFLFFSARQTIYAYLVGHTVSLGLIFACFDGLAFQLWPTWTGWHQWAIFIFIALLNIFTVLFVRRLIESSKHYPRLDRFLTGAIGALVVSSCTTALWRLHALYLVNVFWLLLLGVVLAAAVFWHARKHRPTRIYAVARGLLMLVMAVASVASLGWIPYFTDALSVLRTVASAEVLLAAMAVAASLSETRRALAASREKLSRAFQASPDAITISTLAEGRFLEVNDNFEKISGYPRDEAIGRTSGELGIWQDEGRKRLLAALERDGRVTELSTHIVRKSGEICPVRFSATPIEVGDVPCLVAVVQDVTQLAQASAQRESLIRKLEAQNAELERFTYTVSHDLKSPLISIGGFIGFLEKEALSGNRNQIRHYVERIRAASEHMYRLLDELLELSRIGRVVNPVEDVSLRELATEAAERLEESLRQAGAELEIAPDLPVVRGDRARLFEVYQNLLENAVRFLGDQTQPRIEIGSRRQDGGTVCTVRDNGIGIEPRYHDRIFGLFERLDTDTEGTGIGLALVKRIVEFHGGRVWVESEGKGLGTTFCFVLPAEGPGPSDSS